MAEQASTRKSSSSSLAVRGVDISFQDVTVTLGGSFGRPRNQVLVGATGCVRAGQLSALMGPSGAGKTTLMDVLAHRAPSHTVTGRVLYGQQQPHPAVLQSLLAYVQQQDVLITNLTVLEMLMYTCELRSPPGTPASAIRARAEEVICELKLQTCQHTLIGGGLHRGVSGGERRRVSIGVALVVSPACLLLDEPTSGLDSTAALEVVRVLRGQAERGTTVLASVHQPSTRLLALFDNLLIAVQGSLIYQGPNGAPARQFLQQAFPATAGDMDPALPFPDFVLDCLENAGRSGEVLQRVASGTVRQLSADLGLTNKEGKEDLGTAVAEALDAAARQEKRAASVAVQAAEQQEQRRKGWLGCIIVLMKYRMCADYRSVIFLLPRILDKLGLAFLMATLFLNMGDKDTDSSVYNITNLLYMWTVLPAFSAVGFIPSLMLETELFVRERHAGNYPIVSYLGFKLMSELAVLVLASVPLAVMVWFCVKLSGSFLLFWLPYLVSMAIGIGVAYLCAAVSPTVDLCIILIAGYCISLLFFTGLVINWTDTPGYWKWYAAASYMRYAWSAVMINQFSADPRMFGQVEILTYFSLDGKSAWGQLGIECAFFFGYFALAWAALWAREALAHWRMPKPCWGLGNAANSNVKGEKGTATSSSGTDEV